MVNWLTESVKIQSADVWVYNSSHDYFTNQTPLEPRGVILFGATWNWTRSSGHNCSQTKLSTHQPHLVNIIYFWKSKRVLNIKFGVLSKPSMLSFLCILYFGLEWIWSNMVRLVLLGLEAKNTILPHPEREREPWGRERETEERDRALPCC